MKIDEAIKHIRKYIDYNDINTKVIKSMSQRSPFSHLFPNKTDEIMNLLDEFSMEECLQEDWWCNDYTIDEIIEMI